MSAQAAIPGGIKLGVIFAILIVPPILPLMLINEFPGSATFRTVFFLSLVWILLLVISMSALAAVFKTVLCLFARDGRLPMEFSSEGLR